MKFSEATGMTRADADAIYAYVMRLRPMKVANPKTELDFPFNIRLGMLGWNLLFLHDSLPAVSRRAVTGLAARAIPGQRACSPPQFRPFVSQPIFISCLGSPTCKVR